MIKPGYKETELGPLPVEWEVKKLGELTDITKLAGFEYTLHFNSYKDGGTIIVVRGTNITNNELDLSDVRTIPQSTSNFLKRSKLNRGDLVFAYVGTIGPVYLIPEDNRFHLGPNTAKISPRKSILAGFLLCYFKSEFIKKFIIDNTSTGAQPSLSMTKIRTFLVPCPPLAEQKAIAEALGAVDALLTEQRALLTKKRNLKQATQQALLTGAKRLPGFEGEWEEKALGDLAEMSSGGTPSSSNASYYGNDFPWVSISDITKSGKTIAITERFLSSAGLANSAAQMFPAGTILYAMYASLGECSIAGIPVCSSQAILGIRPKSHLNNIFLYYWLTSIKEEVKLMGQQGTQSNLNKGMVQKFTLFLPSIPEQRAIAQVLTDMDAELESLNQQLAKTEALKAGLMQDLLTGKIRLTGGATASL